MIGSLTRNGKFGWSMARHAPRNVVAEELASLGINGTVTDVGDATDFIDRFVDVINGVTITSEATKQYLATYSFMPQYDGPLNATHMLYWLDRLLKLNRANIGYTTRLSQAGAGWGEAEPDSLTEADPLDLVTTLEGLGWDVVVIDWDADAAGTNNTDVASTTGCVTILRTSDVGADSGDIKCLDGAAKTTTGLFNGNVFRYKFWKQLGDFHERGGGGMRCPNVATSKTVVLIRNAILTPHVVKNENIIGARVETQTVAISGTPSSGTYRIISSNFGTTDELPYNATADEVQAALRALPDLENVTVTSTGTTPNFTHTIRFHRITTVANPALLSSSNTFNQGSIAHVTTQHGEFQIQTLLWNGYPGELPEIWCGNSTQGGDDVTPGQCPDPDDTVSNGSGFIFFPGHAVGKYRDNFNVRNLWFHGKRETAGGDFIYAGGLFYFSSGEGGSVRFCKMTDFSAITPADDNALTYPDIVDFAYDARTVHVPRYKPIYCRQNNFTFDSNYVEFVDIDDWPPDAASTVTVIESANIGLDFGDGVAITGLKFTRNTVKGARYRIACKFDNSVGAYVAYNNIEHYYEESLVGFSTTGAVYEYNRIGFIGNSDLTLTPGLGIGVENSTDAIVRFNVIYSVEPLYSRSRGISVFASGNSGTPQIVNMQVYGNLLYRVLFKVDGNQQVDGGGAAVVPEGLEIYNNLFCGLPEIDKGTRNDAPMYFEIGDPTNGYSGVLDYDVSIHDNGFWRFEDSTPTQPTIEAGAHLRVYDSATSSVAYETDDTLDNFVDNLSVNPQFLDHSEAETNHDFRFATTSPYREYFDTETPLQSQPRAWTPS